MSEFATAALAGDTDRAFVILLNAILHRAKSNPAVIDRQHKLLVYQLANCRYCKGRTDEKKNCPACRPGSIAHRIASELEQRLGPTDLAPEFNAAVELEPERQETLL